MALLLPPRPLRIDRTWAVRCAALLLLAASSCAGGSDDNTGQGSPNRFPCGSSTPILSESTGLEQCARGYVRRVAAANCPSVVPRADAVANYNESIDECQFDADCAGTGSAYAHCGIREGGRARVCVEGCVRDTDCLNGNVCLCDHPVGRCVPASCSTGDDCAPGFDCAEYQAHPGCFSAAFACQTAEDRCGSDADCAGVSPNAAFCIADGGVRTCSIAQCTTP